MKENIILIAACALMIAGWIMFVITDNYSWWGLSILGAFVLTLRNK